MTMILGCLKIFGWGLLLLSPVIIFLLGAIILLGLAVGRKEGWTKFNSVYFAFITATTVGYGDMPPTTKASKVYAILIAGVGLILTGLVVAVALHAVESTLSAKYAIP